MQGCDANCKSVRIRICEAMGPKIILVSWFILFLLFLVLQQPDFPFALISIFLAALELHFPHFLWLWQLATVSCAVETALAPFRLVLCLPRQIFWLARVSCCCGSVFGHVAFGQKRKEKSILWIHMAEEAKEAKEAKRLWRLGNVVRAQSSYC